MPELLLIFDFGSFVPPPKSRLSQSDGFFVPDIEGVVDRNRCLVFGASCSFFLPLTLSQRDGFLEVLEIAKINNPLRLSAYLSTLIGESDYFKDLESKVNDNDNDFGNQNVGDGLLYRGRGAILIRGKDNYILANKSNLNIGNIS